MSAEYLNGFVLHKRAYRETSFLVDLFTLEWGKVSAVVKGVRGNKGDKKSLLQGFQPLLLSLSGRHELRNLNQLEAAGSMFRLAANSLFSAMYINELLNRLLPKEVPHPELYTVYIECLQALQQHVDLELVTLESHLRQFESCLLQDLGYGVDLNYEYDTGREVLPKHNYRFVLEQGIQRVFQTKQSCNYFTGEALIQMQSSEWTKASLHCAKSINRMAISHLLGRKPLKSRELFRQSWQQHKVL